MSKQLNFYLDKEIEQRFLEFILKYDGEVFYEGGSNIKPITIKDFPSDDEKYWFSLYLYKNEFGNITYKEINNRSYIDIVRSPVIEFNRTVVREIGRNKEIGSGRLYFLTDFRNDDNERVKKPSELDDWFELLSKWIRKGTFKDQQTGCYISSPIIDFVNKGYKLM